jgi:hypothetical protein
MTDINDLIQQRKNLSGIFTGAGGDRIPPHGTTHAKNSTDPIPQEIDGFPVDLDGMSTGETIVLDGDGNLVPGAALGSLVSLQTAYDNGGAIVMDDHDLTINVADGYEFKVRDAGGNALIDVSDVSSVATILLSADVLTLKDSNVATPIAIGSVGNVQFNTTDKSIIGSLNEAYALLLSHASRHQNGGADEIDVTGLSGVLADAQTPAAHASTHEDGGADAINAGNLTGTITSTSEKFRVSNSAMTGSTDYFGTEFRDLTLIDTSTTTTDTGGGYVTANDKYVVVSTNNNVLQVFDRRSKSLINSVSLGLGRNVFLPDGRLALNTSTSLYIMSVPDLETQVLKLGIFSGTSIVTVGDDGTLYAFDKTSTYLHTFDSDFNSTTLALTGVNDSRGFAVAKSLNKVFITDDITSPTNDLVLREYNLTTGAAGDTYTLSTPDTVEYYGLPFLDGGLLYVIHSNTGGNGTISCTVFDPSDITAPMFTGSTYVDGNYCGVFEGHVYSRNTSYNILTSSLPAQVSKLSSYIDGSTVNSSVFPYDGENFSTQDWCRAAKELQSDRYNNYLKVDRTGQFTVPSGTATGYFDIEIPGVFDTSGDGEIADLIADVSLFVDQAYASTAFETAQSKHIGAVASPGSATADWDDTLQPNTTIDWLTTIVQLDQADGSLAYRVSWDSTSRAADRVVRYQVSVRGPVWPLDYNPF